MPTNVHLTPELERFVRDCIEGGRYDNISEVVCSGLRLLHDAEERRRNFNALLLQAEEEANREGNLAIDDVLAEADAIIEAGTAS